MGYRFDGEDCAEHKKIGAITNRKTIRRFRMAEMLAQRIPMAGGVGFAESLDAGFSNAGVSNAWPSNASLSNRQAPAGRATLAPRFSAGSGRKSTKVGGTTHVSRVDRRQSRANNGCHEQIHRPVVEDLRLYCFRTRDGGWICTVAAKARCGTGDRR